MNYLSLLSVIILFVIFLLTGFSITYSVLSKTKEQPLCLMTLSPEMTEELMDPNKRKLSNAPSIKLWETGSTIKIYFMNEPDYWFSILGIIYDNMDDALYEPLNKKYKNIKNHEIIPAIKEIIKSRFEPIVNLKFEFVDEIEDSDIRIIFETSKANPQSYVGTDAKSNYNLPTMLLTCFSVKIVMHEFCHALGLLHEHQHPDNPIIWNEENLKEYAEKNGITDERIKINYTNKFYSKYFSYVGTEFDEKSIMKYSISEDLIKNENKEPFTRINYLLSKKDIEGLTKMYPHPFGGHLLEPDKYYEKFYSEMGAIDYEPTDNEILIARFIYVIIILGILLLLLILISVWYLISWLLKRKAPISDFDEIVPLIKQKKE